MERCSLTPSFARPRSRILTGTPPTVATTSSSKACASGRRPRVRSECSRVGPVTLPPGRSVFWRTSASRTAVIGSRKAASRSASIQTLMARSRPPTICTWPTPLARSSRSLTTLSASSVSSRMGRSPDSATVSTGADSLSNFDTMGGSASRGRSRSTVATRSRTSWAAVSMSWSRPNVMMTMELPAEAIERSSSMPATVLTASSIRWETWTSTSSAAAPGSWVRMITVGRSTTGKRSTPRRNQDTAPTTTRDRTSMAANTGRRMQTSASRCTTRYRRPAGAAVTGAPSWSWARPEVATCSPGRAPVTTSIIPSWRAPSVTVRSRAAPSATTKTRVSPAK